MKSDCSIIFHSDFSNLKFKNVPKSKSDKAVFALARMPTKFVKKWAFQFRSG